MSCLNQACISPLAKAEHATPCMFVLQFGAVSGQCRGHPPLGGVVKDVWNRLGADCGLKCITFQPVGLDRAGGLSPLVCGYPPSQRHVEVFPKMSGWPKPETSSFPSKNKACSTSAHL